MDSSQFDVLSELVIPFYDEKHKRTFSQKVRKVRNTILSLLAYRCPNNKLRVYFHKHRGVHIGKNVYIGMYCFIDNLYPEYIYIEDGVCVNAQSMILSHFTPTKRFAPLFQPKVSPVIIGKNTIVAVRSTIMPGVSIGESSLVSAGSVVDKNVPSFSMVRGNPAKIVAEYESLIIEQ